MKSVTDSKLTIFPQTLLLIFFLILALRVRPPGKALATLLFVRFFFLMDLAS